MTSQIGGQTRLFANFDIRQAPEQAKGIRVHDTLIGRIFYSLFSTTVRVNLEGGKSVVVNKNSLTKYLSDNKICSEQEANALSKADIRKLVGNCVSRASKAPEGEKKEQMVAEFKHLYSDLIATRQGQISALKAAADESGASHSVYLDTKEIANLGLTLSRQLGIKLTLTPSPDLKKVTMQGFGDHYVSILSSWSNPARLGDGTFEIAPNFLKGIASALVQQNPGNAQAQAEKLRSSQNEDDKLMGNLLSQCLEESEQPADPELNRELAQIITTGASEPGTQSSGAKLLSSPNELARLGRDLAADEDNLAAYGSGVIVQPAGRQMFASALMGIGVSERDIGRFLANIGPEKPIFIPERALTAFFRMNQLSQSMVAVAARQATPRGGLPELEGEVPPKGALPPAPSSPKREAKPSQERPPSPPSVSTPPSPRASGSSQAASGGAVREEEEVPPETPAARAQTIFASAGGAEGFAALKATRGRGTVAKVFETYAKRGEGLYKKDATTLTNQDYQTIVQFCRGSASSLSAVGEETTGGQLKALFSRNREAQEVLKNLLNTLEAQDEDVQGKSWVAQARQYLTPDVS